MPFEVDVTVLVAPEGSDTERIQVIDCGMPQFGGEWLIPTARRRG
jgi:hypothetical protein